MNSKNLKGFTLIELMIVIAILAILASLAIPAYLDYIIRSKASEGLLFADVYKTSVAEFTFNYNRFPVNNSEAGIAPASEITSTYITALTVRNGVIIVTLGINGVTPGLDTIALTPTITASGINWACGTTADTTLPPKYRSSNCR